MFIKKLHLVQFKNHTNSQFVFDKPISIFVGKNGAGKTNVLDALHYLCLAKSYFNNPDSLNIQLQTDFCRLEANILKDNEDYNLIFKIIANNKKEILLNHAPYEKISDHIGKFPVVMISPNDVALIEEGSEVRRKFMDIILCQLDHNYLNALVIYNRILLQRNALLKQFAERKQINMDLLNSFVLPMKTQANIVYEIRNKYIPLLRDFVIKNYEIITSSAENIDVKYQSDLHENDFESILQNNLQKDLITQRTNAGIHKDDLIFTINGTSLKKMGSQGQLKSFLFALKFAQWMLIYNQVKIKPILLLDDVYERLDETRLDNIMSMLNQFGQVFITDTQKLRLLQKLNKFAITHQFYEIENGKILSHT